MTNSQKATRSAIRAFLMTATLEDLHCELQISLDARDTFRAECIRELIREFDAGDTMGIAKGIRPPGSLIG